MQVGLDVREEEKSWNQQRRRQHICWRKLKSVTLTLAYLLKESGEIEKTIRYAYLPCEESLLTRLLRSKEDLVSAMMTSTYLLEKAMISNDDVSIADWKKSRISNRDVITTITRAVGTIIEAVGTITEAVGTITRAVGTITRAVGRNHHLKGKESVAEIKSH
ncbi:hypothetical protein F511_46194 [Dorcoceras hygrometricum]|uniref:Uncharacterized protein n=1 Tax=Dorcoceras hygrometricum TaxID=472368 RepID=A0A2Z6ZV95_9LAMI|nr:hypothetical protein F511_46194 [Dorcoceras hygrometricum]